MNPLFLATSVFVVFCCSLVGTFGFIRHAHRVGLLDTPNSRSSHEVPTPRGGGLIFSLLALAGWGAFAAAGYIPSTIATALIAPGLLIIAVGYFDDRYNLGRRLRLGVQIAAIALLLLLLKDTRSVYYSGAIPLVLSGLVLIWLINLYNFMDGIDGIASLYGITLCLIAAFLLGIANNLTAMGSLLILAAAISGFLVFNWPPAKVFMGDAGSTFLGFCFGAFILLTYQDMDWMVWLILLACFLGDSCWTLITRIITGQNWTQAHRLHAYQKLAITPGQHRKITLLYSLYTLFWLFPLVCLYQFYNIAPLLLLALAYTPIFALCWRVSAGKEDCHH